MSFDPPVSVPSGYLTGQAIAYLAPNDHAVLVSTAAPLPVRLTPAAAVSTALIGQTSTSGAIGPFAPEPGRAIWLTLTGSWTGSVQLLRSTDGGATRLPLTAAGQPYASYTANANEAVIEDACAGVGYWLAVTLASGTLTYRLAQ